ncbi:hypothetical protein [Streptomyces sp. NPDC002671]
MPESIVTLLVALAGVAGTLASAVLTQRGSERAKNLELAHLDKQRAEDREHDQNDRRHQQRREAYAEFIQLVGSLHSQLYELRSPSHGAESYRAAYEQARAHRADLLKQTHAVLLEGPKEVSDKARDLYNVMNTWLAVAHDVRRTETGESDAGTQSKRRRFTRMREKYTIAREEFVHEAQNALQIR